MSCEFCGQVDCEHLCCECHEYFGHSDCDYANVCDWCCGMTCRCQEIDGEGDE